MRGHMGCCLAWSGWGWELVGEVRAVRAGQRPTATVIASEAKQSILPLRGEMDCFVASLLAMTEDATSHSRRALRPRFAIEFPYPPNRGRRECRVRAAPAVSCASCTKKCAHEHTGSAETLRHPPRNGFTAYIALSPVSGLVVTVTPEKLASRELSASIAAPGPHDFAVRFRAVRQRRLRVHR